MFKDTLNSIISDLNNINSTNDVNTLNSSVIDKLHALLDNYSRCLKLHTNALNKEDSLKVLRGFYK